jgi:hypothetical protein
MKNIKNTLYVLGAILLIIKIFLGDSFTKELNNVLWLSTGVLLLLIIIFEVLTRRK